MKKLAFFAVAILAFGSASSASAQAFYQYPYSQYQQSYQQYNQYQYAMPSLNCVVLTRNLSYGSRGTEVRSLQSFLVAQGYQGSGSWMITGFYGRATEAAVRIFQSSHGLYPSGSVDALTRGAILQTCGYNTAPTYPTIPTYPTYPCTYQYSYGSCPQSNVSISYLSPNQGPIGTTVTITGTGFSSTGNSVRFGGQVIASNITSWNGTSLTFTVPSYISGSSYPQGTHNVTVTNAYGATSNALAFTVTGSYYGAPSITSVTGPTSLNTNTTGTWTITVNNPTNSYISTSVNWGDSSYGYSNASAPQMTYAQGQSTLTFTHAYSNTGTYTVTFTVVSANGQQNSSSATVTVSGYSGTGTVTMYTNPSGGNAPLSTTISMYFPGCSGGNYNLYYGDGASEFVAVPADLCNTTITRSHTYNSNGTFQITLRDMSQVIRGQTSISIGGGTSNTWIMAYPTSGSKPLTVSFNTYPGGMVYNGGVTVNFGDSGVTTLCNTTEICTQRTISHVYTTAGTYNVTMQATQNGVSTVLGTATVVVYN